MNVEKAYRPVVVVSQLRVGNIIRNTGSGNSYVVIGVYGDMATAVRAVDVSNPSEWEVLNTFVRSEVEL